MSTADGFDQGLGVILPKVVGAGALSPLSDGSQVEYANFDYAASAPCIEPVRAALEATLPLYSSVHRGAGWGSVMTTSAYEGSREVVRGFVNGRPDDAVVYTRNTTDSMNLLARCLPPDTTVVVFASEHHASLLPWESRTTVLRLPVPAGPTEAVAAAAAALAGVTGPKLLVVTAASNVTGELWPIGELAEAAHANGARIMADVAQLVSHRPLDVTALDLDYIAFSGHKMYAPFGAGVLLGRSDWLLAADPYLRGGGATELVEDERVRWFDIAERRHEAGTPNVIGAVTLAAACDALLAVGWPVLREIEERTVTAIRSGMAQVPGLRELSLWGPGHDRVGIVSFALDGWPSRRLAEALSQHYGIGVRDGRFCAHPMVRHLLRSAGVTGPADPAAIEWTAVRASVGLGVTREHVDRLVTALDELSMGQAKAA